MCVVEAQGGGAGLVRWRGDTFFESVYRGKANVHKKHKREERGKGQITVHRNGRHQGAKKTPACNQKIRGFGEINIGKAMALNTGEI